VTLSYEFKDPKLLELALTHSSASSSGRDNERMEFLGDAALDLIVAEELYDRAPELPEGQMTELKAAVVSRASLAVVARDMGLDELASVGRGLERRRLSRSVLANLYEAVFAAVYLDGGLEAAREFARETLGASLDGDPEDERSPKQVLQEHVQKRDGLPPTYRMLEERGAMHARAFLVQAETDAESYPPAWGRTVKEAERWAAYEALLVLGMIEP